MIKSEICSIIFTVHFHKLWKDHHSIFLILKLPHASVYHIWFLLNLFVFVSLLRVSGLKALLQTYYWQKVLDSLVSSCMEDAGKVTWQRLLPETDPLVASSILNVWWRKNSYSDMMRHARYGPQNTSSSQSNQQRCDGEHHHRCCVGSAWDRRPHYTCGENHLWIKET